MEITLTPRNAGFRIGNAGHLRRAQPEDRILGPRNDLPGRGRCQVHIHRVHIEG